MSGFNIKYTADSVGLTPFTLRAWKKRYGLLKPKRNSIGRRTYSDSDIERLRLIILLKNAGHRLPDLAQLEIKQLTKLLASKNGKLKQNESFKTHHSFVTHEDLNQLLLFIKNLELDRFKAQIRILQLQLDTRSFLIDVIAPVLREVGIQVASGKLDIFHEHSASALFKHVLTGILFETELATQIRHQSPIIFATPGNDHHEIGCVIAAILTLLQGHKVFYLGPNMPAKSLIKSAKILRSPLLVLAVSAPEESLPRQDLNEFFEVLVDELSPSTQMWVGGARVQGDRDFKSLFRNHDRLIADLREFDLLLAERK